MFSEASIAFFLGMTIQGFAQFLKRVVGFHNVELCVLYIIYI